MTAGLAPAYTWHSWHLHAGSLEPRALDRLLAYAVDPIIDGLTSAAADPPTWFFVRYWLHGPHLRLRIADRTDAQADAIEQDLTTLVAEANATSPPLRPADQASYRRSAAPIAASGEAGRVIDPGRLSPAGVYRQAYEPECERYGGAALMALSERLFCASSDLALGLCRPDADGGTNPLAIGLQALAVSCGTLTEDPTGFLVTMRDRWTQWLHAGQPSIDAATIDRGARKAAGKIAAGREALIGAVRGAHPESWSPWVCAVSLAMDAWQDTLDPAAVRRVFGSHLHMMQNRLGVGAGSEAYLAAILLHLIAESA